MDLKRNYQSVIQPPTQIKINALLNPLLNITNASTPVRTRVIKPGTQLASTLPCHPKPLSTSRSPLPNKENDELNHNLVFSKAEPLKNNINLSPILALNKRLQEGPKLELRSLTPPDFKHLHETTTFNEGSLREHSSNEQAFSLAIKESKNFNPLKSML
jgi:hypothetical protein